ncbi:MAG: hypothetical protein IPK30_12095 [Cellvibrionales bacterium]|nr:hypothetical protein [Cellvibrionales bacterium]
MACCLAGDFAKLFDRLISQDYLNNHEVLYRARILAGIASLYILLIALTSVYVIFCAIF